MIKNAKYVGGARQLFKELHKRGYKIGIISSGPKDLALRTKKDLGIDYIYTNDLIIKNGKLTGDFKWPIGADRKQTILRQLCDENNIFYKDCIVVVHEDNDIKMAKTGGVTIGFNPKGEVKNLEQLCKAYRELQGVVS